MQLALSTERDTRIHAARLRSPRHGRIARRVGGVTGGALRHRIATPSGAIDTVDATWIISGRGDR
jgi:hypothetical protein